MRIEHGQVQMWMLMHMGKFECASYRWADYAERENYPG
jgi:hypothetical protein